MQESGKWDLTPLYESLDDPGIEVDLAELTSLIEGSRGFFEQDKEELVLITEAIKLLEKIEILAHRLFSYMSLLSSADTSISRTIAYMNRMRGVLAGFQEFEVSFKRLLAGQDIAELVKHEALADYGFILQEAKDEAGYLLDAELEEMIARLDIYGVGAWETLFS
ncbi:MAG: M3 family oligoendopeptidase, partial [Clostridiaceae bacterium]|nr:M3 family oligoendopeptidase [Clostridiaceae bacterium]